MSLAQICLSLFSDQYPVGLLVCKTKLPFNLPRIFEKIHESFEKFVEEIDKVLDNLADYADELTTLMTEKFEILTCA